VRKDSETQTFVARDVFFWISGCVLDVIAVTRLERALSGRDESRTFVAARR
jgi:hypothetical protein